MSMRKNISVALSMVILFITVMPVCASARSLVVQSGKMSSQLTHPYLTFVLSEDTGEITITGLSGRMGNDDNSELDLYDESVPRNIVIPDYIGGYPVTKIGNAAFYFNNHILSVIIGDNVREIGGSAFSECESLQRITFGKNVEIVGRFAFDYLPSLEEITSWGEKLKEIAYCAFSEMGLGRKKTIAMPPLPDTVEFIDHMAFSASYVSEVFVIPCSVNEIYADILDSARIKCVIILNKDLNIKESDSIPLILTRDNPIMTQTLYCYKNSTAEANAVSHGCAYHLIDGDSLLWDGEAVEGNALKNCVGMTEAELREHLSIDGTSSEIQIDGLQDGKVVNGTTVTLFHTVAQAPGKVYTVRTPGDADGDGTLSLVDVAQLMRYFAGGWNVEVDLSNADVNADGVVNLKDIAILQRFLAGWDVTLR